MQKRYTTYKASVESFPLGQQNIGLIKPGRFNGFDIFASEGALSISLNHSGQIRKTLTTGVAENLFGALVMPTGIIIHDTDQVLLNIGTNVGNANLRTDLIICEHNYAEIQGGTVATYTVVQGANDGSVPVLPNATKQIVIGKVEVLPEGNTFADLVYIIEPAPLPGDMDPATLYDYINQLIIQAVSENGGEANTASNTGAGVGVFKEKVAVDLQFRSMISSNGSVTFSITDPEVIDVKVGAANDDVINVADHITLLPEHNGKMLRVTTVAQMNITVPEGLPIWFHVGVFQDRATAPDTTGITSFGIIIPIINVITSGNTKVRSAGARNKLKGPGYSLLIQGTGIQDYFVLMGDLTTA